MTKKKSNNNKKGSSPKKSLLQQYIDTTQTEITDRAINNLKSLYKDADILRIDTDIKPILLVLSSDIFNGNHNTSIDNAAMLKIALLTVKSIQEGETPEPQLPDIQNIIPSIQGAIFAIPNFVMCFGSVVECIGKNISRQDDPLISQYGTAMHMGVSSLNNPKASVMYDIGICIGNTIHNETSKKTYYEKATSLVKTLPKNRYSKRLKELVDDIYHSEDPPLKETPKLTEKQKENEVKFNTGDE